jgi:uncharacterized Zn finger protein (UPF0148 family)
MPWMCPQCGVTNVREGKTISCSRCGNRHVRWSNLRELTEEKIPETPHQIVASPRTWNTGPFEPEKPKEDLKQTTISKNAYGERVK